MLSSAWQPELHLAFRKTIFLFTIGSFSLLSECDCFLGELIWDVKNRMGAIGGAE
jgi:hypothetical protein